MNDKEIMDEAIEALAELFALAIYNCALKDVYLLDVDGRIQCRRFARDALKTETPNAEIAVVRKNGEHLPSKKCAFVGNDQISVYDSVYGEVFRDMKSAGYVQKVKSDGN